MNFRLFWYKATHHLLHGANWMVVIGPDMWSRDYGVTWNHGGLPPKPGPSEGWRRWKVEWRIDVRWPISIRRRTFR